MESLRTHQNHEENQSKQSYHKDVEQNVWKRPVEPVRQDKHTIVIIIIVISLISIIIIIVIIIIIIIIIISSSISRLGTAAATAELGDGPVLI